jgi:hypothetical protein
MICGGGNASSNQSREQGILTIWYKDVRDYAPYYRNVQPAKEINKNFSTPHRMIYFREAHMKLDPLQDTYPQREEDIRRFISTS